MIENVIVTKFGNSPPPRPVTINGVLYDHWLQVETGEKRKWDGEKWQVVEEAKHD